MLANHHEKKVMTRRAFSAPFGPRRRGFSPLTPRLMPLFWVGPSLRNRDPIEEAARGGRTLRPGSLSGTPGDGWPGASGHSIPFSLPKWPRSRTLPRRWRSAPRREGRGRATSEVDGADEKPGLRTGGTLAVRVLRQGFSSPGRPFRPGQVERSAGIWKPLVLRLSRVLLASTKRALPSACQP